MALLNPQPVPQPVAQPDSSAVLNIENPDARGLYMQALGAKNILPPLERSSHLRIIKSGVVLPWNKTLAEQKGFVECCDEHGNTDPNAWMSTVQNEMTPEQEQKRMNALLQESLVARQQIKAAAAELTDRYKSEDAVDLKPKEAPYTYGAVTYSAAADLMRIVES